ncbi:hypothetical protein AMECASPLE_036781 [Ameca splendens]|uniref:Uncharacterized protein n=1 Tax=Ameca splendens TaxID=208324 RepID=A0ABV0ZU34_9TELE
MYNLNKYLPNYGNKLVWLNFQSVMMDSYSSYLSSYAYPGPGRRSSSLSRDTQTSLCSHTSSGSAWGKLEAFPSQPSDIVPPACPEPSTGPPPVVMWLEFLSKEAFRRHPEQMAVSPQLNTPVEEQRHCT